MHELAPPDEKKGPPLLPLAILLAILALALLAWVAWRLGGLLLPNLA